MAMITPSEIKQKCLRRYSDFLRTVLSNGSFFPLQFPVGSTPNDFVTRRTGIALLRSQNKEALGYGYSITFRQINTRNSGPQTVPIQISVGDESDFLQLIGKAREVAAFKEACAQILDHLPQLHAWIVQNQLKVIEFTEKWSSLIQVCQYFIEHSHPNLYMRIVIASQKGHKQGRAERHGL